jgi:spore maturation protein CgeB
VPKVLIAGENLAGSVGLSFADAFRSLGWTVVYSPLSAQGATLSTVFDRAMARVAAPFRAAELNRKLAATARRESPDLSLVIKGHRVTAETVAVLRRASAMGVANFYPDDPFSESAVNRASPKMLSAYSACFTFAEHLLPSYREAGVANAFYLPFARDPALHFPTSGVEVEFDCVFVGNLDDDRVAWLESIADFKIAVFGHQTKKALPARSALHGAAFFAPVFGGDLSKALARGRVSLNFMRRQNLGSHNMRSFESPACGAYTLSQRTPELMRLFRDGIEIDSFGNADELRERMHAALADPQRRRQIADAGFERVEHDTYARRAQTILDRMS